MVRKNTTLHCLHSLHILKLSEFSYTDPYATLGTCFCKDQNRRNSAPSFSTTEWLYIGTLLHLEAAATQNNGQKKDSENFAVAFNMRISHFVLTKKVTTALSSFMQVQGSPLNMSLSITQYHQQRRMKKSFQCTRNRSEEAINVSFLLLFSYLFKHSKDIIHYTVSP